MYLWWKVSKEKVLEWLLHQRVNGVCHCGVVVPLSSFLYSSVIPTQTIKFFEDKVILILSSLCPPHSHKVLGHIVGIV